MGTTGAQFPTAIPTPYLLTTALIFPWAYHFLGGVYSVIGGKIYTDFLFPPFLEIFHFLLTPAPTVCYLALLKEAFVHGWLLISRTQVNPCALYDFFSILPDAQFFLSEPTICFQINQLLANKVNKNQHPIAGFFLLCQNSTLMSALMTYLCAWKPF
jgi:hypothetical protein